MGLTTNDFRYRAGEVGSGVPRRIAWVSLSKAVTEDKVDGSRGAVIEAVL